MQIRQASVFLAALAVAVAAVPVFANPEGPQVVHGSANFSQPNAHTLNVTNSHNAIINWQSFNIDSGQTTNFIQPGSNSAVMNRVLSNSPSKIYGNLNSNGKVFLINQHGLMIGAGAQINTAGFFGSTLNITNEDFLNGNLKFEGGGFGGIQNYGYIHAGPNGNVVLVAPDIENGGVIEVDNGNVILAAGESIRITSLNDAAIEFELQAPENGIVNLGEIIANQGAARLFAGHLKHSGSINATGVVRNADGSISLVAQQDIEVAAGASLTADGDEGGGIRVQSHHGDVYFQGQASARGETHHGGRIEILGARVGLFGDARVDASGNAGGGEVLIGGDFQGKGETQTARQTQVGPHARIHADALESGDGGEVIVWADDTTVFAGEATARGGENDGDGGFIEISGKQKLDFSGMVDASAASGEAGAVLFDPRNLTVEAAGTATPPELTDNLFDYNEPTDSTDSSITPQAITNITDTGTAVTLSANNDLTIDAAITTNNAVAAGGAITLQSGRSILINADIDTDSGLLTLIANDFFFNGATDADRSPGPAEITMADGVTIDTGSANLVITLEDAADKADPEAGNITLATILTNDMLITHNGQNLDNSILRTATGSITANSIFIDHDDFDLGAGGNRTIGTPGAPMSFVADFIAAHIHGSSTGGIYVDAQPRAAPNVTAGDTCYGEGNAGCFSHGIRGFDTDQGELVLNVTGGGLAVTEPIDIAGLLTITAVGDITTNPDSNAKPILIRGDAVTLTSTTGSVNLNGGLSAANLDASIESTPGFNGDVTVKTQNGSLILTEGNGSDAYIVADNGTNALVFDACSTCVPIGFDPRGDGLATSGVAASNFAAAVSWDGGAGTLQWADALNWSTDNLPLGNADVTINSGVAETIGLAGGVHDVRSLNIDAINDFAISGVSTQLNVLDGATLAGASFTLGTGAFLNLEGASNSIAAGTGFSNNGTITLLPATADVQLTLGGVATNAGTIVLDNTDGGVARLVAGGTIVNTGTIQSVGAGLPNETDGFFDNQGLLDLDHDLSAQGGLANFILRGGTLDLAAGVNFDLAVQNFAWDDGTIFGTPTSTITGSPIQIGLFASGGNLTLDGGMTLSIPDAGVTDDGSNGPTTLNINAGVLDVFGFLFADNGGVVNLNGGSIDLNTGGLFTLDNQIYLFGATFNWLDGSITATGVTGAGGSPRGLIFIDSSAGATTFNIDGPGSHVLDDVDIRNFENLNFTNGAVLDLFNSVTISNEFGTGQIDFVGNGGISIGGGAGPFVLNNDNVITMPAAGSAFIDPVVNMGSGSLLDIQSGTMTLTSGLLLPANTTLSGNGTLIADVTVNGGIVQPGGPNAAGALIVTGSYTQTSGQLQIEIQSTGVPGVDYDQLIIEGPADLLGNLSLFAIGGYTVADNDSFTPVTYSSRNLANQFVIDPVGVENVSPTYNTTSLDLVLTFATSMFWDGGGGTNNWSDPFNWSLNFVPDATFDVSISGATVNVTTDESVNSLSLNGNLNLNLGGSLTIVGGLAVGSGTLTVAGGSLAAGGASNFDGSYAQSGGSATFTGNAVFNGGYSHSDGATTFAGSATFNGANAHSGAASTTAFNGTSDFFGATSISGGLLSFNNVGTMHNLNNTWSGGTIGGAAGPNLVLGVSPGDTRLSITGAAPKTLSTITLDMNQNDIVMSGSGGLTFVNATIDNTNGTSFDHSGNGSFLGAGTFDNTDGHFNKLSGSLFIPSTINFINTAGSQVNVAGGSLAFQAAVADPAIYNVGGAGALIFPNGRNLGGTLNLQGSLLSGGTLVLPGTFNSTGNLSLNNATLDLTNLGGTLNLSNGASLAGTGIVAGNVLNSSGVLVVGGAGSIGNLAISGNYGQGAGGAMVVDVFNNGFTTVSDLLTVSGTANLNGTLVIGFTTSSLGLVTASFQPFSFGGVNGNFSRVIDAAGNILQLQFIGGEFTILGTSPTVPDSVIDDLLKFAEDGKELADEIADNRSEADAVIEAMLEEAQDSGELVCR